jgi:hypothetical protein
LLRLWWLKRDLSSVTLLRPAAAAALALFVVVIPVALPSIGLLSSGTFSHSAKAADEHSAAPVDYVIPNPLHPVWGQPFMSAHAQQNVIESSLYLGVVVGAIAVAGWWWGRKSHEADSGEARSKRGVWIAWLIVLLVSFVLSLGLYLHDTNGQVQLTGGGAFPLPGLVLFDFLPLYSSMRAYARFGVIAMLASAALMGLGWRGISARWPRHSAGLGLVAALLLLVDFWTGPYSWGTSKVAQGPTAAFLASAPAGTVIELPLTAALTGPSLYDEVYLNKPIAYGYDTFEPPKWSEARQVLVDFPSEASMTLLKAWDVRYVVVSGNAFGADWPGTLEYLKSLPGLRWLGTFQEARAWDVDPGVLDARPDMEEYAVPDNRAVFEIVP